MKGIFSFLNSEKKPVEQDTSEIQRVAAMARACMGTKEFKEYRARYEVLQAKIIDELIKDARMFSADQTDMAKFGAKCLVRLTRLNDLRSLLESVAADENRDKS